MGHGGGCPAQTMNFFKSNPIVFAPRAEESVSEFLARVQLSLRERQVDPLSGEDLGEYLLLLRTRRKRSVEQVAATLGNAFPKLGITPARIARLESGDRSALSDDGIRVLAGYYGGSPEKALALARVPSASTTWGAMSARAWGDLALAPEEREFLENVLANIVDELRKENSAS